VACLVAVATAQPIRPQISETYEGEGYSHITTVNETIWGLGRWVVDEPNGHALEFWEFVHEHYRMSVNVLKRYDLGNEYAIMWDPHPTPHRVCHKRQVHAPMPPNWAWVKSAHYIGKHHIDGSTYDLWRYHAGGIELEVAVSEHDASRPHYYTRRSSTEHRMYHLISWSTFRPNATWFNVPDICKNSTSSSEDAGLGADSFVSGVCATAASSAAAIVEQSNNHDAASLIGESFRRAGVTTPSSSLTAIQFSGKACVGGPRVGDIFFDGMPASSGAVYLGDNKFAECSVLGGCKIVAQRDFTGGCRRYC